MAENGVIGRDGGLPWRLPADLKRFKAITLGCPVLMGRKTFASLGKALPGRLNLVLTRAEFAVPDGVRVASVDDALRRARATDAAWTWVIGGAAVYAGTLALADCLEVTRVHADIAGDVVFPAVEWSAFRCVQRQAHAADATHAHSFSFERWERRA